MFHAKPRLADGRSALPAVSPTFTVEVLEGRQLLSASSHHYHAPPAAPTNLMAVAMSQTQVQLSWSDNADNETGYVVQRKSSKHGAYVVVATLPANTTSFLNRRLPSGSSYWYEVAAVNSGSYSAYTPGEWVVTPAFPAQVTPTPTPSPSPTSTPTPTPSPSPTSTPTPIASPTATPSPTPVPTPTPAPVPSAGVRVSADGHSLVNADGSPFFYLADTAWSLFLNLTPQAAETYLQTRAAQGFTVIQATITTGLIGPNVYGALPFIKNDPSRPNEAYFQNVDAIVNEAAQLGLTLVIDPGWGNLVSTPGQIIFNATNARAYGQFLGARYASAPIMWMLGGDTSASGYEGVYDAMAEGLRGGDGGSQLITYHPTGQASSSQWFADDSNFDLNFIQSGHIRGYDSYDLVSSDYAQTPIKPTIDAESAYEGIYNNLTPGDGVLNDYDVREAAYETVFAGAAGYTYGNANVYFFYDGVHDIEGFGATTPWQDALNSPGALEMAPLKSLMLSRPYLGRVPDQSILASGSGDDVANRVQAIRGGDSSYAFVYTAAGNAVTIKMGRITGGSVNAAWYDPRTGDWRPIGTYAASGNRTFTPPSSGTGNDWVLVLDDATKGYSAPG